MCPFTLALAAAPIAGGTGPCALGRFGKLMVEPTTGRVIGGL